VGDDIHLVAQASACRHTHRAQLGQNPNDEMPSSAATRRAGLLFDYEWDARAHAALGETWRFDRAGFDLFSFPSNARLIAFDLERFAAAQARRARHRGWSGVLSHHEQFGALAAALVAEAAGLPGPRPEAILACQHKLHARRVLQRVAPEANLPVEPLDVAYGDDIPDGLNYPAFVKPVKAAFSVLATRVETREQLQAHTRFGWRELWVIRRLVEPFERVARQRLPDAGSAHRMMLEAPVQAPQYNLDGYVHRGQLHTLGVVDAVMYPGTQAFMRWEVPSRLDPAVQARAADVARRFLEAVGFDDGMFNMEFFHDPVSDKLTVIEFNPRLASQFGDLYRRVDGVDPHAMALALATGQDPATVPRGPPQAGAAASFVYRAFDTASLPPMPTWSQRRRLAHEFPDSLLFLFPKQGHSLQRDFKWLGSHRYGIVHLGGHDRSQLQRRCLEASAVLGWPAPLHHDWERPTTSGWSAAAPVTAGARVLAHARLGS
jgi:biotin carboxylase